MSTYSGFITLASVADGTSGQTFYTWIRYSPNSTGTPMTSAPDSDTKYIGIAYNKLNVDPSTTPADYTWSRYVGENGEDGDDGRGISSSEIKYQKGISGIDHPTGTWSTDIPEIGPGEYLWTRIVLKYTDNTESTSYSVSKYGINGETFYTWIKYADTPTSGMSDNPTGKNYIGIAHNKSTPTESTNYGDYSWSLVKGADGTSYYTHIRYSEHSDGTNFVTQPTASTLYIGVYTGTSAIAPTTKTSYTWSRYVGQNGEDGHDGNGINSITYYYLTNNSSSIPAPESIISTQMEMPTVTKRYLWQKEVIDFSDVAVVDKTTVSLLAVYGETGAAGTTITSTSVEYAVSNNGSTPPSTEWEEDIPTVEKGQYLWTKTTVNYSNGSSTNTYSVAYKGTDGTNGEDGNGIESIDYTYAVTTTQVAPSPSEIIAPNPPALTPINKFLWQKEIITYTVANPQVTIVLLGVYGDTGEGGKDGTSVTVTSIGYQESSSATTPPSGTWSTNPIEVSPGNYLWTQTIYSDSTVAYNIARQGENGTNGEDGITYYTWVKYSDIETPTSAAQIYDEPRSTTISIGMAFNKTSATESSDPSQYTWKKFVGQDGQDGRGISSTAISYAIGDSGTTEPQEGWQSTVPAVPQGKFLWTRTITTYTSGSPATTTTYSVGFFGEDGQDGTAATYLIESSSSNIYKFYEAASSELVFSPDSIQFVVYKTELDETEQLDSRTNYNTEISLVGKTEFSNLWQFLYSVQGNFGSEETPVWDRVYNRVRHITNPESPSVLYFDFGQCFKCIADTSKNTSAIVEKFNRLKEILSTENCYFKLEVFNETPGSVVPVSPTPANLVTSSVISLIFGTSKDMAHFALTAADIQMAVNEANLKFDANGLTVTGGGFKILDKDNAELLGYDPTGKYLNIVGSGRFSGNIIAESGTIGGFTIGDTELTSNDGTTLVLNGSNGKIIANDIELGTATLTHAIKLGNAAIYAPTTDNNNAILKSQNVTLDDNGILKIGNITINGDTENGVIQGSTFKISDNESYFNNITIGGKITSTVFEVNKIQSAGGSMIFKPSYKVTNVSYNGTNTILTIDGEYNNTDTEPYLYLIKNGEASSPIKSSAHANNTFTLSGNQSDVDSLIIIGSSNDILIGINSTNSQNAFLPARGLAISEFQESDSTLKVFLGDLNPIGYSGYGLFAENAYLTGSLTTSSGNKYAGVNTLNGAAATKFGTDDTSPIIFWAGSNSTSANDIQNAPFQVSQDGSIYAQRGRFEGGIISNSEIYGAEIHTAHIYGYESESAQAALNIHDATHGINFYQGNNVLLSISGSQLRASKTFIDLSNNSIKFIGDSAELGQFKFDGDTIQSTGSAFNLSVDNQNYITLSQNIAQLHNTIEFENLMRYSPVVNGYDLYVEEVTNR